MTLRSERLQVVLTLEERKEQEALERMNLVREQWQQEQDRLDELEQYLRDYHQQMRADQQGTVAVSRLQGWLEFVGRLDRLIGEQKKRLDQTEQRLDAARQQWQRAWERRRGMEKYIETCRSQEQRARDLAEQKLTDEAAAHRFSRRR